MADLETKLNTLAKDGWRVKWVNTNSDLKLELIVLLEREH